MPPFNWAVWAHVAGGIAILALVLWRVALRRSRGAPPPPEGEGTLLGRAATLGHWALYALMLLMPVSGLVAWFGGVDTAADAHEVMSNLMLFQLQRHSDHHAFPKRRYAVLRHHPDSPQLPGGYSAMFVLALCPPLWHRVIDPRVIAFRQARGT